MVPGVEMVVWLRKQQEGIAIPDGVIRRDSWLAVGSLDAAFVAVEELRQKTLQEAQDAANAIVEGAHHRAEGILAKAHKDAEVMFEVAKESGWQDGADKWAAAMINNAREAQQQLRQQRERMARIVISAVEKIIPLQDPQGTYRQVLKMLTKSMQTIRYVSVRVALQDAEYAESSLRELAKGTTLGKLIEVIGDERLAPGACLVETDQGIIDLSLNSQLKALRAAITLSVFAPAPTVTARHSD
jgi:type III secretion protein L